MENEETTYEEVHVYLSQGRFPLEAKKQEKCIVRKSQELQLASIYRPLVIHDKDGEEVDPHLVVYVPLVQQQIGKDGRG